MKLKKVIFKIWESWQNRFKKSEVLVSRDQTKTIPFLLKDKRK